MKLHDPFPDFFTDPFPDKFPYIVISYLATQKATKAIVTQLFLRLNFIEFIEVPFSLPLTNYENLIYLKAISP